MEIAADSIGIFGVSLILLAYGLISAEKVSNRSLSYHLLNLVGAVCILLSLMVHWNLPSFVIEVCWIAISLYGIWRVLAAKKNLSE